MATTEFQNIALELPDVIRELEARFGVAAAGRVVVAVPRPISRRRSARDEVILRLVAVLRSVQIQRERRERQMEKLIDSMMPELSVPTPVIVLQARRNAEARAAFLEEFGGLTSAEVGEIAGSGAGNKVALASRWRAGGKIFSVVHQGANLFPPFQFNADGQPLPVISEILERFGKIFSDWEIALWLTGRNGHLSGGRPIDLLRSSPRRVVAAVEQEAAGVVF